MRITITHYSQFEQGTELWLISRLGLPTCSCLNTVMAKGVKDERSVTREKYISRLTAELMTNVPTVTYKNDYMQRGNDLEDDALAAYAAQTGADIDHVAFIRNDEIKLGCSPDGLIGKEGGVEAKVLIPELFVDLLCAPGVPQRHMAQVHGNMLVTGRKWWDVIMYCPGFEPYIERVGREHGWTEEIRKYLVEFQDALEARVLKATKGKYTWIGLREQCDRYIAERIEEVMPSADLLPGPWPKPTPTPPSITEKLRESLAMEDE